MQCGATRIIRTHAPLIRTSFSSDRSWNQIPRSRVSSLAFTAVGTNSEGEDQTFMSQSGVSAGLAVRQMLDIAVPPARCRNAMTKRQELELKMRAVQIG